eukprot:g9586.t1
MSLAVIRRRDIVATRLQTPLLMAFASQRLLSPCLQLAELESCRTDVDYVRKELEETTWHVVHPYSCAEFPGVVDPRINFTVTWFLDPLDAENSTWATVKEQSFRALTDAQRAAQPREELCPTVLQATYVREYVAPLHPAPPMQVLEPLGFAGRQLAELLHR